MSERLTIHVHGFGLNRRWEFQLAEGEDVPARETVISWISRFIDTARLEILRDALDTYEQERSHHVREILHGTLFIGNRLLGDSLFQ